VIDTVYTNAGGFFTHFAETSNLPCPYVLLEAKNYTFDVGNPEFDQIGARLVDEVGKLGLLVCRKIDDQVAASKHCQDLLSDNHKHVILLTDRDVLDLLDLSAASDKSAIGEFMDRKIRALVFRSKK
jgi:hypothetical protein